MVSSSVYYVPIQLRFHSFTISAFIHLFFLVFINSFLLHTYSFMHSSIFLFFHLFAHFFIYSSFVRYIHAFVYPFAYSFLQSYVSHLSNIFETCILLQINFYFKIYSIKIAKFRKELFLHFSFPPYFFNRFTGKMDRNKAEATLNHKPDGTFLIRESVNREGEYALSVR